MNFDSAALHDLFASPFDASSWTDVLADLFGVRHDPNAQLFVRPHALRPTASGDQGFHLGSFTTSDGYLIGLFRYEISSGSVLRRKVGLRALVRPFLGYDYDAALVVFNDRDTPAWRFSFICDIKEEATAPKRFTYVFGDPATPYRTPVERFLELRNSREDGKTVAFGGDGHVYGMKDAFSVEALSKQFYGELFDWYCRAIAPESGVYFPNDPENGYDDRENIDIKIIRLVTRVLFTWFIRRKGLIPESIFDEAFLSHVLKDFDPLSKTSGCYYNAILQNLFFGTLNTPILDEETGTPMRQFAKGTEQQPGNLYRYAEMFSVPEAEAIAVFSRIPYMNGGLFECLDRPKGLYKDEFAKNGKREMLYDGFSRNSARDSKTGRFKRRAFIPNVLFFDRDESAPGLFPLLSRYNFTVEENAPNDAEVSLDPELLGKVFENLLGTYNPETSESARKSSGSFYTRREIVAHMVKEALNSYMRGHEGDTPQERIARLKKVRVLDLACGSGAFPMECLAELVARIESISREAGLPFDRRQTKLDIIRNCLFGVDIQSIAMMITKLRFFISLVCEQGAPTFDPASNYGVETLPNLETRFVAANSLLTAKIHRFQAGLFDTPLETLQKELFRIRADYFKARTRKEKFRLRANDKAKCAEIRAHIFSSLGQPDEDQIVRWETDLARERENLRAVAAPLWRDMTESERAGIGVQQTLFGMEESEPAQPSLFRIDANEKPRKAAKARIAELEKKIREEKAKANIDGFSDAVGEVTEWKPYDQVHVEGFFDPEWMFGVKDGFDIVVGNPPYINFSKRKDLGAFYKPYGFQTFDSSGDIYCLFYERGWQLLKDGGHLCYITSNKWMRAGYGEALRRFLAEKTNPEILIDFAGEKIFESATVDTNILLFQKGAKNAGKTIAAIGAPECRNDLSGFVRRHHEICSFKANESWVILSAIEQSIKAKIERIGTPLKDWDIQIYRGILTGCNEAFIINETRRAEILSWCKSPAERKRTDELIRPILRGRDIKRYGYDWAGLYILALFPARHYDIEDFPAIKRHLLSFAAEALVEGGRPDLAAEPFLSQFCRAKLEQSGKVIRMGGKPVVLRKRDGKTEEQKARKRTTNKWFETQDTIAYWDDFSKPKIVWGNLCLHSSFSKAPEGMFANAPSPMIVPYSDYILAVLNSRLGDWYIRQLGVTRNGGYFEYKPMFVEQLPIPKLSRLEQARFLSDLTIVSPTQETESAIDEKVFSLYGLSKEERLFILFR